MKQFWSKRLSQEEALEAARQVQAAEYRAAVERLATLEAESATVPDINSGRRLEQSGGFWISGSC